MYQRDYLMRQIEQAARVLAAIMRKALSGEPDEALISLLTSGSMPDLRRVASVLEVVKSEADVHTQAGNQQAAATRYRRALTLAGYLAGRSDELLDTGLAGDLVERTGGMALSPSQRLA